MLSGYPHSLVLIYETFYFLIHYFFLQIKNGGFAVKNIGGPA